MQSGQREVVNVFANWQLIIVCWFTCRQHVVVCRCSEIELLIELFINEYEQAKILIYWMRNIFISLDHFYTKSTSIGTLSLNALKLCNSELLINSKEYLFVLPLFPSMIILTHILCMHMTLIRKQSHLRMVSHHARLSNCWRSSPTSRMQWTSSEQCSKHF